MSKKPPPMMGQMDDEEMSTPMEMKANSPKKEESPMDDFQKADSEPETQLLSLSPDFVKGQKEMKAGMPVSVVVQGNVTDMRDDGSVVIEVKRMDRVGGNPPPLGSGERFEDLKTKLSGKKGVTDPAALAASIGRKKYGSARFQALSQGGKD